MRIKPTLKKQLFITLGVSLLASSLAHGSAPNFAGRGNSEFFYKIGGANSAPAPATRRTSVPIGVSADVGAGYSCGVFDPQAAITNAMNDWANSFSNIADSVLGNATAYIASFPSYVLARANPTLFDLLTNNLISAHNQLDLSTTSCEALEQQISTGGDPYNQWNVNAVAADWQNQMSNVADINRARETVQTNQGRNGIPWAGERNAGGEGQPPIFVIEDTVIAGYNLLLNRNVLDVSAPAASDDNQRLIETWPSPTDAVAWTVAVVGDQKITTYVNGDKDSVPGVGLLPATDALATDTHELLSAIVLGEAAPSQANLLQVSAPNMQINTDIIDALSQMNPNQQAFVLEKVAQEMAMMTVIEEALLAKQILFMGAQVPAIKASTPAQDEIIKARNMLDEEINNLLVTMRLSREMASNTLLDILLDQNNTAAQSFDTPFFQEDTPPMLEDGAIFINQ